MIATVYSIFDIYFNKVFKSIFAYMHSILLLYIFSKETKIISCYFYLGSIPNSLSLLETELREIRLDNNLLSGMYVNKCTVYLNLRPL